jgi:hypothetical protein
VESGTAIGTSSVQSGGECRRVNPIAKVDLIVLDEGLNHYQGHQPGSRIPAAPAPFAHWERDGLVNK